MLKLRLKRCGRKRMPVYRLVVMRAQNRRDGRAIKELGFYNPLTKELSLNVPEIVANLKVGVQPTRTVRNLLIKQNIIEK